MKRLLIAGDSFAVDEPGGWANSLAQQFDTDNLAQRGSSEYRIWKSINSADIDSYDAIIVVHTTHHRIYVESNPFYRDSSTHAGCDLIYKDMCQRQPDPFADHVSWWFENVFDLEQAKHMHQLMCADLINKLQHKNTLHMSFFDLKYVPAVNILYDIWKNHFGDVNHLNDTGNQQVLDFVQRHLTL